MADNKDPAVSVCFTVPIDDDELGYFNTCEGSALEVVIEQREEGGNNGFVWQLPTRIKYGNVKLSRPVGKDSAKLTAWLCSFARGQTADRDHHGDDPRPGSGRVRNLGGVIPVRWTGPSLNPDSPEGGDGDRGVGPSRLPAWPRRPAPRKAELTCPTSTSS